MSIPSSSELVATIAFSVPRLSWSSIWSRCSRAIEPWWARASSSPASSLRRAARRSARRRALTNTIVERCARISSSTWGWIAGQIDPCGGAVPGVAGPCIDGIRCGVSETPDRSAMSSTGTTTSTSIGLRSPASTIVTGRGPLAVWPPRNRAISSSGRWVADRPIRCGGSCASSSRRSSESARCAPRLEPAIAWISSTITQRTLRRISRAWEVEHQVERLRRGDQDVGRAGLDPAAFARRGVAGAHRDARLVDVLAEALGREPDPGEGRPQVLLDVDGERSERRDVQDAAPLVRRAAADRSSGGRAPTGTPRASCPNRSARGSANAGRRRSPATPAPARRWASRTCSGTTLGRRGRSPPGSPLHRTANARHGRSDLRHPGRARAGAGRSLRPPASRRSARTPAPGRTEPANPDRGGRT